MEMRVRLRWLCAMLAIAVGLSCVVGTTFAWGASAKAPAAAEQATIEETVLWDEEGVKITALGLEKGSFGVELKMLIENNTDVNYTVQCRNASINGYMMETSMSTEVAAGKKASSKVTFMKRSLEACGITTISDIELSFHVFLTDDWGTAFDTPQIALTTSAFEDYVYTFDDEGEVLFEGEGVTIVLKGLDKEASFMGPGVVLYIQTSAFEDYVYTFDDEGEVLFEGEGVTIVLKGLDKEASFMGPGVVLYIQNDSDRNITVQVRQESVNDYMVPGSMSCEVAAGKRAIDDVTFYTKYLEESGIEAIEKVELSFHVFDTASWDTVVDTDLVTMSF